MWIQYKCYIRSQIQKFYKKIKTKRININWLDNRLNPMMNNLMSIDHATRDYIDDTDYLLPRMSMEFPRISSQY